LKNKVSSNNLTLYNLSTLCLAKNKDIILGNSNRDEIIEKWKEWIKLLDSIDVRVTVFTWEPSGVWSTHKNIVRGDTISRACDEE